MFLAGPNVLRSKLKIVFEKLRRAKSFRGEKSTCYTLSSIRSGKIILANCDLDSEDMYSALLDSLQVSNTQKSCTRDFTYVTKWYIYCLLQSNNCSTTQDKM